MNCSDGALQVGLGIFSPLLWPGCCGICMPGVWLWAVAAVGLCFALRGRKFACGTCGKQQWVKKDLLGVCQFSDHLQPGLSSACVINQEIWEGGEIGAPLAFCSNLPCQLRGPVEPNLGSTLHFPLKVVFHHCSASFLLSGFGSVCGSGLQAGSGGLIN